MPCSKEGKAVAAPWRSQSPKAWPMNPTMENDFVRSLGPSSDSTDKSSTQPRNGVVGQFAVAALYERRNLLNQKPAVIEAATRNQTDPLLAMYLTFVSL
jgi:hypothetical protein